ncbi:MAG: amidohydrolase family protein [Rhodospirillaceae bacterium]|nr:amidohydrolase family protein [Rhodospirillaceae bacterium]
MSVFDPDGTRLPIKIDSTTNGEFVPSPLPKVNRVANAAALTRADDIRKSLGVSRRDFLVSTTGAAATLMTFNEVHAAAGARGGYFDLPREAAYEMAAADSVLKGSEFVFDIQGHHVSPIAKWKNPGISWAMLFKQIPGAQCAPPEKLGQYGHLDCIGRDAFVKELFLDSDTSMGVLTFVPTTEDNMPLSTAEAQATKQIVDALDGSERLLLHGRVIPNLPGDIARMPELLKTWKIAAWKTYTQFNEGWWLDDDKTGIPFLEAVRSSGQKLVCVHKGLPLPPMGDQLQFSRSDDVGRAAKKFKDITFIVYHSGYDDTIKEGPFVPGSGKGGVDSLVQSLLDNGIAPNSNVYAELGTTWRTVMKDPDQTAHVLGKLIKYVGEDRVVWGTDSIWYGSPQDQIQALRAFQISDEFCEKYGYAKLTPQIKAKILGLNAAVPYKIQPKTLQRKAANDALAKWKAAYAEQPDPSFMTFGPKTRGEFLRFWKSGGHT